MYVRQVQAESGKSAPVIFLDMIWCCLRYGIGYLEYRTFGFAFQDNAHRRSYMTMRDNHRLCKRLNDPQKRGMLENKFAFLQTYGHLAGREWLDLRSGSQADFECFLQKHGTLFVKTPDGFGGQGVEKICRDSVKDIGQLYNRLIAEGKILAEQEIEQHPKMRALCPESVNTLRIVTIVEQGQVHVMYVILRMGNGRGNVDNITSGGMYAPVDRSGVVCEEAFCDKTGCFYERHPVSGMAIRGFEIPLFHQAIKLVKQAAEVVPSVRYVGWDVAIGPNAPVLVEGNTLPGFYIRQNFRHLGADKMGAKPDFTAVLGAEF